MQTLANTLENNAKVKALKIIENTVGKIYWDGNTVHRNMQSCLMAINLNSNNSGWYNPICIRIDGLKGWWMVNQDGSLFCESRVIKQDENKYLIEHLSNEGYSKFEGLYSEIINEQ